MLKPRTANLHYLELLGSEAFTSNCTFLFYNKLFRKYTGTFPHINPTWTPWQPKLNSYAWKSPAIEEYDRYLSIRCPDSGC